MKSLKNKSLIIISNKSLIQINLMTFLSQSIELTSDNLNDNTSEKKWIRLKADEQFFIFRQMNSLQLPDWHGHLPMATGVLIKTLFKTWLEIKYL